MDLVISILLVVFFERIQLKNPALGLLKFLRFKPHANQKCSKWKPLFVSSVISFHNSRKKKQKKYNRDSNQQNLCWKIQINPKEYFVAQTSVTCSCGETSVIFSFIYERGSGEGELKHIKLERKMRCLINFFLEMKKLTTGHTCRVTILFLLRCRHEFKVAVEQPHHWGLFQTHVRTIALLN